MKKVLVILFVAFTSFASSVYALELNEYKVFYKLNNSKTVNSLSNYLEIDSEQKAQLKHVMFLTELKLKDALKNENEIEAEKALWFNLGNIKLVLTAEQYKKYLTVLNMSVHNEPEVFMAEK